MMPRLAILFCLASCVAAQEPGELLDKIRSRIAESAQRLPNYLCTETVERQVFALPPARGERSCAEWIEKADQPKVSAKMTGTDRLRLDVALSTKGEMYSWVGEGRFDDRALSEIVNSGTTSTGAFGSFLRAIFTTQAATFTFKEKQRVNGHTILRYDFAVPLSRSGYSVSNGTLARRTGYTGWFTADADTQDLLSLQIKTDALPEELKTCRTTSDIRYTKIKVSDAEVFIPSEVMVDVLGADGEISHNRTEFRSCHQFLGESKIIFNDAPSDSKSEAASSAKAISKEVPSDLKVTVALTQEIDPTVAAAGDAITGKLTRPMKNGKTGFEIAKGAKLHGRIVAVRRRYQEGAVLELGLRWETIEVGGVEQPIVLSGQSALPVSANLRSNVWIAATAPSGRKGGGIFQIPFMSERYKVPVGFETTWLTQVVSTK